MEGVGVVTGVWSLGEYGGGVWRCEEVSPHTSALHYGHRRTAQGPYYCAVGAGNVYGRDIVEAHYRLSVSVVQISSTILGSLQGLSVRRHQGQRGERRGEQKYEYVFSQPWSFCV